MHQKWTDSVLNENKIVDVLVIIDLIAVILVHIKFEISSPWYSGQCSCLSRWRSGFNARARQIFKSTFSPSAPSPLVAITKPYSTFKITQILSPETGSERKRMSTVEPFIWVNLYSLDLTL